VGVNQNSTIVFPLPLDVIRPFLQAAAASGEQSAEQSAGESDGRPEITPPEGPEALPVAPAPAERSG
jgi:hypothetical protein